MTRRRAVYTALIGGYETLVEQPVALTSETRFICFTDDPSLTSDTWEIRHVEPGFPLDAVRSARHLKLSGHADLEAFDETLWIDNSVRLKTDPADILESWLDGANIAMPLHSYRRSVVAEFQEILLMGMDDPTRVYEQLVHYSSLYPEVLESVPYWTALIARRRAEDSLRFGAVWRDHVMRYSRRDQLSVRVAETVTGVAIHAVEIDNRGSSLHEWPVSTGRQSRPALFRTSDMLQPPAARIGQLQRELDEVTRELTHAVRAREEKIAQLEGLVSSIYGSRSWRSLRFARAIRSAFSRRSRA